MQHIRQNQLLLSAAVLVAGILLSSCRKSAEEITALISDSEAAEIIENTVSERSSGNATPTVDFSQMLQNLLQSCGETGDTSFHKTKSSAGISYDYTFGLEWLVSCNNLNIPQSASVDVSSNGTYATQRWSGNTQGAGELAFTGLNPQSTEYVANGTYTSTGSVTGKLRKKDPTLNCQTNMVLSDLKISKSSYKITGGTGTVTVTVSAGNGSSETLNGTLVFNNDGTVTVTVNGHSHTFPLQ